MSTQKFSKHFKRKIKVAGNYDLFGVDTNEEMHYGKIFVHLFDSVFSRFRIDSCKFDVEGLVDCVVKKYSIPENQTVRIDKAKKDNIYEVNYERHNEILLIIKEGLCLWVTNDLVDIIYKPGISLEERNALLEIVQQYKKAETQIPKFYMVKRGNNGFDLAEFEIKNCNIDIETHYNSDFEQIHKIILKALSEDYKSGLVLLHGTFGTGKTSYLRHLISTVKKKFIYLPIHLLEALNSPEFLPFISEHPNSILLLEDCESLLSPRDNGNTNASGLSNLLNLGDGLLSDALSLNVICTFNAHIKKIDDALLRKGRLIARYEFKELEVAKAQNLSNKIGKKIIVDRPMTVSEIYNYDEANFENVPRKVIGFSINHNNHSLHAVGE